FKKLKKVIRFCAIRTMRTILKILRFKTKYETLQNCNCIDNYCDVQKTVLKINNNYQVLDAVLSHIDENPNNGSYKYKIIKTETINLHERIDKVLIYDINVV